MHPDKRREFFVGRDRAIAAHLAHEPPALYDQDVLDVDALERRLPSEAGYRILYAVFPPIAITMRRVPTYLEVFRAQATLTQMLGYLRQEEVARPAANAIKDTDTFIRQHARKTFPRRILFSNTGDSIERGVYHSALQLFATRPGLYAPQQLPCLFPRWQGNAQPV